MSEPAGTAAGRVETEVMPELRGDAARESLRGDALPVAVMRARRRSWWPWLVPLLAVVALGVLARQAWMARGPVVVVEFVDGAGIGAGDPVSYRGMRVGQVLAVRLSGDLARVEVEARLARDAAGLARAGSRFWIVKPEISAGRVSGLDALLGPRYMACEPGPSEGKREWRFVGLERAPGGGLDAQTARGGALELVIEAGQLGTLGVDSPVVYRGVKVGSVRSARLAPNAQTVELIVVIDAEYRPLVRTNTRFWNAGGIGLDFGLTRGVQLRAGPLEAVMGGAIGFATPTRAGEAAAHGARFPLADAVKDEWLQWSPVIELGAP